MSHRRMLLSAGFLVVSAAGFLSAQEPPPTPPANRPTMRRMHPPGTGLSDSIMPMRERMGPGARGMGRGGPALLGPGVQTYGPRVLLSRRDLLALSDEQVSQLEQLEADVTAAREKAIADARTHQDALVEAFQAARPDENTIRTHAQAIVQARQAAEVQAITTHARAKAVLTAEQQAKMEGWVAGQRMGRAGAVGRGAGMRGIRGMRPGMGMRRMPGAGWRF